MQTPADSMAEVLVELGVPRDAIVLERQSRTTAENALFSKPLLEERGAHRVLRRHVGGAHAAIDRGLPQPRLRSDSGPADFATAALIDYGELAIWIPDPGALTSTTAALKEWQGILVYRLRGQIRSGCALELRCDPGRCRD